MRRAQDRAQSARSRKIGARSATFKNSGARSATIKYYGAQSATIKSRALGISNFVIFHRIFYIEVPAIAEGLLFNNMAEFLLLGS